jgi:protein-tyrosine phosphatase
VTAILVVCTGNICRSPMAEAFLRSMLAERGVDGVETASCGVSGWEGSPAVPEAIQAMQENGIDVSAHRARRIEPQMVRESDLILAMAGEHRDAVVRLVPQASSRTFTIKELVRLLDHLPPNGASADDAAGAGRRLTETAAAAAVLRDGGAVPSSRDEDVADPLGLGVEAFRATAWEIEQLCRKVVTAVFDAGLSHVDEGVRREGGAR